MVSIAAALKLAEEAELDLVEIAPTAKPPVCRVMDFGKFKYEKRKKSHHHTHQTKLKEIRLRPKTGDHDIEFKIKQAVGFLQHKDKVQVSVVFKGRENAHIDEGERVMQSVIQKLLEHGKIESPPSKQGSKILCTIAPK